MKLELKAISVWSAVKIGFVLNLIMGFVMGLLAAIIMVPVMALMSSVVPQTAYGSEAPTEMSFGILLVVLPIAYAIGAAIFGTIAFAIGAGVYNFSARILGGLEYTVAVTEWQEMAGQGYPPAQPQYASYPPQPGPQYPPYGYTGQYATPPPRQYNQSQPAAPQRPVEPTPPPAPEYRPSPTPPPPPPVEPERPSEDRPQDENERP